LLKSAGVRVHYGGPVLGVDDLLGPGLDDFLAWAEARGEPVPARCAEVALVLLALRGAPVRGGLPQPAAKLLGQVLRDDLPHLVCGAAEEVATYPRVLGLLIDHQRAAGLMNVDRHRALHAAVRKAVPDYEQAVRDPLRLTWPRLYGGLLRADGVQAADQQAVREWFTDYRSRSGRRAALVSTLGDSDDSAGGRGEEGWVERAVTLRLQVTILDLQTRNTELQLYGQLQQWVNGRLRTAGRALKAAGQHRRPQASGQAVDGGGRAGVETLGERDAAVDFLVDRATAAGLSAALRGDFSDLAAGAGSAADDVLLTQLRRRRKWPDADAVPLPPVEDVSAERFAGLVRKSALLAAAVELAEWVAQRGGLRCPPEAPDAMPAGDDLELAAAGAGLSAQAVPEVWRVALAAGLLRVLDGQVVAGRALQAWRDGSAAEVLELALDALAAVVAELARLAERAEDAGVTPDDCHILANLAENMPHTLFHLYSNVEPESLARWAAVVRDWAVSWPAEEADPEDRAAPAASLDTRLRPPRPRRLHPDAVPPMLPFEAGTEAGSGAVDSDDSLEYRLPPNHELEWLLGVDDLDYNDQVDLLELAYWHALLLDRLDALGVVRRDGDRVELTTLGRTLLRAVLLQAGFAAPTYRGVAEGCAHTLLRGMASWSNRVGLDALQAWLQARQDTDTGWKELLQATAAGPRGHRQVVFGLLGVWSPPGRAPHPAKDLRLPVPLERPEAEQSLVAALHEAVPDPVTGAYAAEALRSRGVPPADPPRSAQAVQLLDRFGPLRYAEIRLDRLEDKDAGPGTALCAAFDAAAADWPGGPGGLLRELAAVSEPTDADIFTLIGDTHPALMVAAAARAARDYIGCGPPQAAPDRGTAPQPPASSGQRQRPASKPARKRKHRR
jgi:hypothetical protein